MIRFVDTGAEAKVRPSPTVVPDRPIATLDARAAEAPAKPVKATRKSRKAA